MKRAIFFGIFLAIIQVNHSYAADREEMDKLLTGRFWKNVKPLLFSFTIADSTELIEIARQSSYTDTVRATAIHVFSALNGPESLQTWKNLCSVVTPAMLKQTQMNLGPIENRPKQPEDYFHKETMVYQHLMIAIGRIASEEAIDFLKNEFQPETWAARDRGTISNELIDDLFRLKVFDGLAEAAIKKPELFEYLDDAARQADGQFKMNMDDLLPEYKEKYYLANPKQLPPPGYFLQRFDNPKESISFTQWRIEHFFSKNKRLPNRLTDLSIKKGGLAAFIGNDKYNMKRNSILGYDWILKEEEGRQSWTYILYSVGPNGKKEIVFKKPEPGMHAKYILEKAGDDIYKVLTYKHAR